MVPLAIAVAVLVGAGVLRGVRYQATTAPGRVTVRVIDAGAAGGPKGNDLTEGPRYILRGGHRLESGWP